MTANPNDSDGISFGEVEHVQPDERLRPDENKHYSVVPVFNPDNSDLPIYVDVDAMSDMEQHALTDTDVELGGVMLGGQYVDQNGNPFVLITDSIRAQHYESTKGSFKFTHETWSDISRQREEFPDDLQMVGWYHTHPGWGVFLSGMDMFICDNFFNKPLDVALVIDPCKQDRGMFMWLDSTASRVRRTSGFYLVGSRFRESELVAIASQLESEVPMVDPRYASSNPQVIQVGGQNPPWMLAAVLGVLAMQMMLMTIIAWKVLAPDAGPAIADKQMKALQDQLDTIQAREEERLATEAQLRILDQVVSQFGQGGRPDPISLLAKKDAELMKARQDMEVANAAGRFAVEKHQQSELQGQQLALKVESLEEDLTKIKKERDELKDFKKTTQKAKKGKAGESELSEGQRSPWFWGAIAAVGCFLAAAIGALFLGKQPPAEETPGPEFSSDMDGDADAPPADRPDPRAQ